MGRKGGEMKRLLIILALAAFLSGCGTAAKESEFWENDSMYRNWNHLKYSWGGYKKDADIAVEQTKEQNWWGIPKEVE
jgi:hypothetical protein